MWFCLLHAKLKKSRFHHIEHQNIDCWTILDFWTILNVLILQFRLESRQLANNNIELTPQDKFLWSHVEKEIIILKQKMRQKCKVPKSQPAWICLHYQQSWFFIFWFMVNDILPIFLENMKSRKRGMTWH